MLPDMKEGRRRLADALHPNGFAWRRQEIQLAAGARRSDLLGYEALLAEGGAAIRPPARRRNLAAAHD